MVQRETRRQPEPAPAPRVANNDKLIKDLESGLQIEEHALNESLLEQPDLLYRVSKALAYAISERDAAKQDLAVIEAKVDTELRRAAAVNDEKVTEKQVAANLIMDRRVQAGINELAALNFEVGKLSALKEAYLQRSYMLKEMVSLYCANYYDASSQSRTNRSMNDRHGDEARTAMHAERRRNR